MNDLIVPIILIYFPHWSMQYQLFIRSDYRLELRKEGSARITSSCSRMLPSSARRRPRHLPRIAALRSLDGQEWSRRPDLDVFRLRATLQAVL
jgi:hypothetical protein